MPDRTACVALGQVSEPWPVAVPARRRILVIRLIHTQ